eukprot:TRINITY_DN95997_c0_g1_i1.p1 TRINITY_DN95997_c0_g1~~TRINITY_DN95997_c0_g1_i1.p1  ORF type:complete len:307 (+),score=43.73 TRINITY_DN95997_c0_g1_i1:193-1113(+)
MATMASKKEPTPASMAAAGTVPNFALPCSAPAPDYAITDPGIRDAQDRRYVNGFCGRLNPTESLNSDPFNIRAEELALQECTMGVEVRRMWTEQEMVRSFGGHITPGTPDGMFESWDGDLTCVQVVRVPLTVSDDVSVMQTILVDTLLTKVVKSQSWLRLSHTTPQEFIIFCWLPYSVPATVTDHVKIVMDRVQKLDHRFSLRLHTPAEPSLIFPSLFARNYESSRSSRSRSYTECDVATYQGSEQSDDDDEEEYFSWDITWGWDADLALSLEHSLPSKSLSEVVCITAADDDDWIPEWNIWDDNG